MGVAVTILTKMKNTGTVSERIHLCKWRFSITKWKGVVDRKKRFTITATAGNYILQLFSSS
jgi:hypothetical protein